MSPANHDDISPEKRTDAAPALAPVAAVGMNEKKTTDVSHLELSAAPATAGMGAGEQGEMSAGQALNAGKWSVLREDAIAAEDAERNLSVKESLRLYPRAIFWSFSISLCIIMEGMDLGLVGNVIAIEPFRRKFGYYTGEANGYQLTPAWQTAFGQASTLGCFIGIFIAGWAQDRWGYRRTLQVGLVALTGFIFIVFFAPTIEVLFIGQLLCGLPWGAFSSSAVSYASDVTPVSLRGYLTTYVNLCWIIGQFIAAGIFVGVSGRTDEWAFRIPFAVQWVWPIPLFILATLAPESPYHLVRKGRYDEAEVVVQRLARKDVAINPTHTVAMMIRTNEYEKQTQSGTSYLDCLKGVDLRRTEIGCMAWAGQILAGSSFANQPTYFFQQAGLPISASFQLSLGVTALAFVGTCCSWIIMTHVGRRRIYITGTFLLTIILFLIGGTSVVAADGSDTARWGQAGLVMVWVLVFDLSIAPIAYCIVGETSSTRLRAKSVGIARNFYNVISVTSNVLNTYQMNPTAWGWAGLSGFFWGGFALLTFIWAFFRLPECKGRTYHELDVLFERRISARKFKNAVVNEEDEE